MIFRMIWLILLVVPLCATPLAEQFMKAGYVEVCKNGPEFDSLYARFDECIEFLQTNPSWAHKLYAAKERFIRSKDKSLYSTDFFGYYEKKEEISFYYSTHFHEFIYPEVEEVPEIARFLDACREIQEYGNLFEEPAVELGIEYSVLLKVIRYSPSYVAARPHYDGSALTLFLDSTDRGSLLLSPYKSSFSVDDFSAKWDNSILLIPGTFLGEFSIYPTPHIVVESGTARYSTVAFAMRPNFTPKKMKLSPLPKFK